MAGGGVGDSAQQTHRRSKPLGPGAPAARHWGGSVRGYWGRSLRPPKGSIPGPMATEGEEASSPAHESPAAVDRRPSNPRGEARLPEMGSPPGAERSKPINTARGTPEDRQLRDDDACAYKLKHHAQGYGVVVTPAFRAPSFHEGDEGRHYQATASPRRK